MTLPTTLVVLVQTLSMAARMLLWPTMSGTSSNSPFRARVKTQCVDRERVTGVAKNDPKHYRNGVGICLQDASSCRTRERASCVWSGCLVANLVHLRFGLGPGERPPVVDEKQNRYQQTHKCADSGRLEIVPELRATHHSPVPSASPTDGNSTENTCRPTKMPV